MPLSGDSNSNGNMRVPTSTFLTRLRKLMVSEVPAVAAYIGKSIL